MLTRKEYNKTVKELETIHAEIKITENEIDRLQNHWFLKWFTLSKQGKLINKVFVLLEKSQKHLDKFNELK